MEFDASIRYTGYVCKCPRVTDAAGLQMEKGCRLVQKRVNWPITAMLTLVLLLVPQLAMAAEMEPLGERLPVWSIVPFVGMLLSIAIVPLINGEWWENNQGKAAIFWSLVFLIPFTIFYGMGETVFELFHSILLDYVPFIILLFGLFCATGGIVLRGKLRGTPKVNVIFLAIGTLIASWIGTTGAAMVLIRPLIRANKWRVRKKHTIIFFIFLVCNIGGALTPVGDPPLFMGFLRGVPFFWTTKHLLLPYLMNSAILLVVYYFLDRRAYKKDMEELDGKIPDDGEEGKLRVEGARNFIFLGMIVLAVILSGVLTKLPLFADQATGEAYGLKLYEYGGEVVIWSYLSIMRDVIILVAAYLAMKFSTKEARAFNDFSWAPIAEVAKLFAGIFITMIPALAILGAKGASLGLAHPAQFFWGSGVLSSFLDNTPTYVVFFTTAASLHAHDVPGVMTNLGLMPEHILMAISCGSVFMGANTYIGNAPNFMVRSIAENSDIKMPSFFGYMGWALVFLIPLFIINTLVFFLPYAA
ncbi:Na+/H+ antiporter NhaD [Peptococcus niger]|uniref:Na+/H+ antiporter NhaD n=1 Tax=Peptococcus niger TaxID=2741 RepID=A0A1G6T0C1_PEPNI|nr:Na+/H+ antiporter NhaD [Peptococcus niger]